MIRIFLALCLFPLWSAAAQAGSFTPPAGCTGWLTVQARACRVSNYYKCAADTPGDQWRADFDQEGIFFASRINREGEWLESLDMNPMVRQTLVPNSPDPASFSDLLQGKDTFIFDLSRDDGTSSHVEGYDKLTGKSFVIDGINLQQTEFQYRETDGAGNLLRQSRGNEYINPDWRLFFSGPSEWDGGDGYVPMDGSPVEFIFPGDKGFMSTEPLFECDAVLSSYHPPETNHVH